jgi:hypothetical protein
VFGSRGRWRSGGSAQRANQAEKSKEETRVYAYQKKLPETPPADAVAAVQRRRAPAPAYLSDEITYGAQGWWREHERLICVCAEPDRPPSLEEGRQLSVGRSGRRSAGRRCRRRAFPRTILVCRRRGIRGIGPSTGRGADPWAGRSRGLRLPACVRSEEPEPGAAGQRPREREPLTLAPLPRDPSATASAPPFGTPRAPRGASKPAGCDWRPWRPLARF